MADVTMANTINGKKGADVTVSGRRGVRTPTPVVEDNNPPLPTGEVPIPHHPFGSAYLPSFLRDWGSPEAHRVRFANLNCSFFSHPTNPIPPTLLQLKQHAQAICSLLQTLCASDHEYAPRPIDTNGSVTDAFDWLEDLDRPYDNKSQTHNLPLYSLSNTISTHTAADGSTTRLAGCPFGQTEPGKEQTVRLLEHANALLELLDHKAQAQGGLFSLMPAPGTEGRELIEGTILGQWLVYTTNLVQRVSELEAEVANAREVLAGEAMVPMRLVSQGTDAIGDAVAAAAADAAADGRAGTAAEGLGGRVMVFPQDRYVLANCGAGLWERLNEELAAREQGNEARERDRARTLRGGKVRGEPSEGHVLQPVTYMDVQSRIYRVKGCQSLFVIPAFDIHPDTEGTRRVEAKGMVQTVVRPLEYALGGRDRWERTLATEAREAKERDRNASRRARGLREEVAGLRRDLEERGQELERERVKNRGLRTLERDLAVKEGLVRTQMETMRTERLRLGLEAGSGVAGAGEPLLLEGARQPGKSAAEPSSRLRSKSGSEAVAQVLKKTLGSTGVEKKGKGLRQKRRVEVELEEEGMEEGGTEG